MKLSLTKRSKRILASLVAVALIYSVWTYFDIKSSMHEREWDCYDALYSRVDGTMDPEELFIKELDSLQKLVEYSLYARSQMLEVASNLRINTGEALSSRDLVILKQGTEDYLEIREELYDFAEAYECAMYLEDSTLEKNGVSHYIRLKASMISLAAGLTLYDNYLLGTIMFEQDERLRKVINDPDMGFGLVAGKLREMTLAANSIENRQRIRNVIKFYETEKGEYPQRQEDEDFLYLETLIESSPSYNYAKKVRVKEIGSNKLITFNRIAQDLIDESVKEGFDVLSGLFGNTAGLYESRKGKLYGDSLALQNIQRHLKPLDILLEKTPFRLTDKMIPGHFGHVAIWTGTKAEIIELGLWDDMVIRQYHEEVGNEEDPNSKNEQQVIEALRPGVELNTLEHFMNIDDFAILRPRFEGDKEELKKEALIMAFRQVGKEYDFNFNVNTTDKIVCSELAYVSFPDFDWPTEKTLGRHSISPDNVAQLAWENIPLELILFYHDGQLIDSTQQLTLMKDLMTK